MSALLSLVIIRIVMATAAEYGLSQYALDVLVRTLVLELLPLLVACTSRCASRMPSGEPVAELRAAGGAARDVAQPAAIRRATCCCRGCWPACSAVVLLAALGACWRWC
jgi:phospholipid/cholesterol/gamma-HCH transport system permease protein